MTKLTERDVLAPFIGKAVNSETYANVAYKNGNQYMSCNADYIDDPQYCGLFGITYRLKWMWEYSGIEYSIFLTVEDGIITKAHIDKIRELSGGHGRPITKVLSISQQELRVARRILQYITN